VSIEQPTAWFTCAFIANLLSPKKPFVPFAAKVEIFLYVVIEDGAFVEINVGKEVEIEVGVNVGKEVEIEVGVNVGKGVGIEVGVNDGKEDGIEVVVNVAIEVGVNVVKEGLSIGIETGVAIGNEVEFNRSKSTEATHSS
jgi:hypothetical protein